MQCAIIIKLILDSLASGGSALLMHAHMYIYTAIPHGMHVVCACNSNAITGLQNLNVFLSKHFHILSLWSKTGEALPERLNKEQRHAIWRALESSFFLIQGPPG